MLWSLTKILMFMVALTAITFGASFLMEAQGGLTIEYGGIELNLKPLQATLLMFFFADMCVVFIKVDRLTDCSGTFYKWRRDCIVSVF